LQEDTNAVVSGNRVCIQTQFPLTTAFVFPFFRAPTLPPSCALCSTLPLCHCLFFFFFLPRSAIRSALSPSLAATSLSSLSLSAVLLLWPPPPHRGASAATPTTTQTPTTTSRSLFDIFFFYRRDAHHHRRLSLSLPLFNFFFCLTSFYIFRSLPLLCRLFSTIVVHTLPLSLLFRFIHSMFLFN